MKTFCEYCGRETYRSATTDRRRKAACHLDGGPNFYAGDDCMSFAAGRRAAFKQMLGWAVKASYERDANIDVVVRQIRAALKSKGKK